MRHARHVSANNLQQERGVRHPESCFQGPCESSRAYSLRSHFQPCQDLDPDGFELLQVDWVGFDLGGLIGTDD